MSGKTSNLANKTNWIDLNWFSKMKFLLTEEFFMTILTDSKLVFSKSSVYISSKFAMYNVIQMKKV